MPVPNFKRIALFVQKLIGGPKFPNWVIVSHDPGHARLDVQGNFCLFHVINVKKLVRLKHGVRAINQKENSTDHFCEDTRQNALSGCRYKSMSRDTMFTA